MLEFSPLADGDTAHAMHHFEMGHWVMFLAYATSVIGSIVGLACARQAGLAATARYRQVWRLSAAITIGGIGIWLMHFIAMLGFGVPGSQVRYDPWRTAISALLSIAAVYTGLVVAGPRVRLIRLLAGGVVMGLAVALMHYTGMWAVRIQGTITETLPLVLVSIVIAVVASTVALWFTLSMESIPSRVAAALVMGVAVVGMHYTGMASVQVDVEHAAPPPSGWDVFSFLFPIFVLSFFVLAVPITALMIAPDRRDRHVPETMTMAVRPTALRH
jgi:NO-binding membrane sensor protein with MHYT domain